MIEHVYRRASAARSIAAVIVATDDRRIAEAVSAFGGDVRMTSTSHQSGTDRLAEVAASLDCDLIVNVQGDEPLIEPEMIDEAIAPFASDPALEMSTLRKRIDDAVRAAQSERDEGRRKRSRTSRCTSPVRRFRTRAKAARRRRHGDTSDCTSTGAIRCCASRGLPPGALEQSEALEQLRALAHGIGIKCVETACESIGVDTPADLDRVRALLAAQPMATAGPKPRSTVHG